MTANNPYTSVTISGYNSSPPPDDGSKTSANQLEWDKHKTKLGDPLKTAIEAITANVNSAFGSLILTDSPDQETLIEAMAEFQQPAAVMQSQRALFALRAASADSITVDENIILTIAEFA